jgi:7-cyano-7-deazaguanine synthase
MENLNSAVVLFSGGQDSTTCLYWAKQNFQSVFALGFDYKQKHNVELDQAKKIATRANIDFKIIDIDLRIREDARANRYDFIKVRNSIFFLLTSNFANQNNIKNIVAGMCKSDNANFPDCRLEFVSKVNECANLSLESNIKFHLPLLHLSKAEVWKLGKELGILEIIINDTHTDYNGDRSNLNEWGYGSLNNLASIVRAQGFEEAKQKGWL